MADEELARLYTTQQSLTEWLQEIGHKDTDALRAEDNEKRERLKVLKELIDLPFDEPVQFEAADLQNETSAFMAYLAKQGKELCALRLIPKESGLPKLRMRGKSIAEAYKWFKEQDIDASKYRADILPHTFKNTWSTIFIINQYGIQGEIIRGGHHQLTQGIYEEATPIVFHYDFTGWQLNPHSDQALKHLRKLVEFLHVTDKTTQKKLIKELGSTFAHNYLEGYFETTDTPKVGIWFKDYAPLLGQLYSDFSVEPPGANTDTLLRGQVGCKGQATGPAHIVNADQIDAATLPEGSILVCAVTTPKYVPLMQKAAAIVTDQGGILSHAAIVARELKKPCIVATGNATEVLRPGQVVIVDADSGQVRLQP